MKGERLMEETDMDCSKHEVARNTVSERGGRRESRKAEVLPEADG